MEPETLGEKKPEKGKEAAEMEEEGGEKEEIQEEEEEKEKEKKEEEEEKGEEEKKGKGGKKAGGSRKRGRKKGEGSSKKAEVGGEEMKTKKARGSKVVEEHATPKDRPVRDRKKVDRFSALSSEKFSASKSFSIKKGQGMQLKDIPNVAYKLSKRKADENLQRLHTILFGKKSIKYHLKRNICQFSGFVWAENEEKQRVKVKEKIDKCVKERLFDFFELLDIPVSKATKKEELSATLLEFLESPHATTEVSLAEKEQSRKGKKRKRMPKGSKDISPGEAPAESSIKKRKENHEVSEVKSGQKSSSMAEEKVESESENESAGSESASEDDDVVHEESDHEDGQSKEEDEKPNEHVKIKKNSAKKQVKGSETKTKGKTVVVKTSPTSKSLKSNSNSSLKKDVSSDEDDNDAAQEEESDHPKSESGEEEDEQKEHVERKKVSSKKPVKGSAAKKGKAAIVKKDSAAKSFNSPSKSLTKKGDNVSSPPSTSKSKGRASEKEVKKKSKESKNSSAKEKKTNKKQAKSGEKTSTEKRTGKHKVTIKVKSGPSREEMLAAVTEILKEVDFNTATLSDILVELGDHFEMDLMHKKAEVKSIIEEVINNMTDDEDEEEDNVEDDAEEADKDGDE